MTPCAVGAPPAILCRKDCDCQCPLHSGHELERVDYHKTPCGRLWLSALREGK